MSREKQGYRELIEYLNSRYPDQDYFSRADVARIRGCSVKTVQRLGIFAPGVRRISKPDLARRMCI